MKRICTLIALLVAPMVAVRTAESDDGGRKSRNTAAASLLPEGSPGEECGAIFGDAKPPLPLFTK